MYKNLSSVYGQTTNCVKQDDDTRQEGWLSLRYQPKNDLTTEDDCKRDCTGNSQSCDFYFFANSMTPKCWFGQFEQAFDFTTFQQQMPVNVAVTLNFKKGET